MLEEGFPHPLYIAAAAGHGDVCLAILRAAQCGDPKLRRAKCVDDAYVHDRTHGGRVVAQVAAQHVARGTPGTAALYSALDVAGAYVTRTPMGM